ncbi:MAG TPA: hypothetical protein VNT99_10420 [Methylomirabilota bacterium]|nr:hypothetical protein [Methylomirabilota bacterium]
MMWTDGIKEVVKKQPFRPFVIKMTSGATFEINHPEFFAVSPSYRRMYVVMDEEHTEIIDTLLVESVRIKESATR